MRRWYVLRRLRWWETELEGGEEEQLASTLLSVDEEMSMEGVGDLSMVVMLGSVCNSGHNGSYSDIRGSNRC